MDNSAKPRSEHRGQPAPHFVHDQSEMSRIQLRGGIVMGLGMALTEETNFDPRNGRMINRSLAG